MTALSSLLFNVVFFSYNMVLLLLLGFLLPFPRRWSQVTTRVWTKGAVMVIKGMLGLTFEVRGTPPQGPCVIVSKHQSAWDTFVFYLLVNDPNYVLKKELTRLPVWGWCALKCGAISVDRDGGGAALKQLVRDVEARMADGRQVVIFPEGTRKPPGAHGDYQPGVAAIYARTEAPVVPVALNSGLFWGRRSFMKQSGVITVEFLDAMPKGLKRREFMAELENRMDVAADALIGEAKTRFPHLNDGP